MHGISRAGIVRRYSSGIRIRTIGELVPCTPARHFTVSFGTTDERPEIPQIFGRPVVWERTRRRLVLRFMPSQSVQEISWRWRIGLRGEVSTVEAHHDPGRACFGRDPGGANSGTLDPVLIGADYRRNFASASSASSASFDFNRLRRTVIFFAGELTVRVIGERPRVRLSNADNLITVRR
jgi:hypothetical protein